MLLVGASIAVPLIAAGVIHFGEISYFLGKDPTLTGRTQIWKSVGAEIMKHPILGYGYCAFWRGYQGESANSALTNGWAVTSAHNGFLQTWLTLGAVGLAFQQ